MPGRFKLSFDLGNDAFAENPEGEAARILEDVAKRIRAGETMPIRLTPTDTSDSVLVMGQVAPPR